METAELLTRLDRIEAALALLIDQRQSKEWYTTADVAEVVDKAEYTVREWCRQNRVKAEKRPDGRGWMISHDELQRIRNFGPLPIPKHDLDRVLNGRGK